MCDSINLFCILAGQNRAYIRAIVSRLDREIRKDVPDVYPATFVGEKSE